MYTQDRHVGIGAMLILVLIGFSLVFGTITDATNKVTSACNGSTQAFTFSFPIVETSDLVVIHRVTSTGVETELDETTHYEVTATNNDYSNGGTVTTVSKYATGITLTIIRDVPESQDADLEDSKVLRVEDLEGALDRLTLQVQDLEEELGRCLKFPRTETNDSELDTSIDRASTTLGFDASGDLTYN